MPVIDCWVWLEAFSLPLSWQIDIVSVELGKRLTHNPMVRMMEKK